MAWSEIEAILGKYRVAKANRHPYDVLSHEVYMINLQYEIVYANQKKRRKYGEDIIGKKCYDVFPVHKPIDTNCSNCPCLVVLNDPSRQSSRNECFETIDRMGARRFISETAVPLKDDAGLAVLALVLGRNITKRVKLEALKKNFFSALGSDYDKHLQLVVNGLHDVGYKRVRLYDVIDDCLSPGNALFVLRAGAGDIKKKPGYQFHFSDNGYKEALLKLKPLEGKIDDDCNAHDLTEAKLLTDAELAPDNRCVVDLDLKNIPWIMLPFFSQIPAGDATTPSMRRLVGLLSIDNGKGEGSPVSPDDLVLLKSFADFLGEAIIAVRAEMNVRILNQISQLITQKRVRGETHELIAKEVCDTMKAGMCSIFIYSEANQKLERHANYISKEIIPGGDFGPEWTENYVQDSVYLTARCYAEGRALNITDFARIKEAPHAEQFKYEGTFGKVHWDYITQYESYAVKKTGKRVHSIKNAIFAPLRFEGHNIGVIRLVNNFADGHFPFPDSDIELLQSIASQIAAHSHYEGMKTSLENTIRVISHTIAEQKFDLKGIAQDIISNLRKMSKAYAATLFLKDEGRNVLKSVAKEGYPDDFPGELEYSLNVDADSPGIGISAWVALNGEPFEAIKCEDIIGHKAHCGKYEQLLYGSAHAESMIAVPMKIGTHVIGVLKVEDPEPNKFTRSVRTLFDIMTHLTSLAIYSIQEIDRRQDLMIALGHELAAPAVAVASLGAVMKRRYSQPQEFPEGEETISVGKRRLLDYCSDVESAGSHLTFVTSGREALDTYARYTFKTLHLKQLVWEVIDVLRPRARWKHIDINFDSDSPRCTIMMDRNKLKQALYNLLYNAIKYSEKNQSITITLRTHGVGVVLTVQDWGIGVPAADSPRIFEKGARASNAFSKDPTGMGLGLYYTRLIVKGHQGSITLTNPKSPTEFTLMLPFQITAGGVGERNSLR